MDVVGWVAVGIIAVLVVGGVAIGVINAPDARRYMKMRRM